jgi:hypothetical protein
MIELGKTLINMSIKYMQIIDRNFIEVTKELIKIKRGVLNEKNYYSPNY